MTWYLVAWITWACPGGLFSGWVSPKLRPFLCEEACETQTFDRRSDADKHVDRIGPIAKPKLWKYIGMRREALPTTFNPNTKR